MASTSRDLGAAHAGRRLSLFLPDLTGGGAERMMVNLAASFAEAGVEVDLVLARAKGPYLRGLPASVGVVDLDARGVASSLPKLVHYLVRRRPDAVLTTLVHASVIAVVAGKLAPVPVRVFVRLATTYSRAGAKSGRSRLAFRLFPLILPWSECVIAVSDGAAEDLGRFIDGARVRLQTIYSPVVTDDIDEKCREVPPHTWLRPGAPPVVLGVGRLAEPKGFADLIRAFARLRETHDARLVILGEGEERERLERLAGQLGVEDEVSMPGFVDNPFAYMARARVFVLSSLWEGLPGALIQAMACGCPVVSTDCPSGPREILEDGRYGQLVRPGHVEDLSEAIATTLERATEPRVLRQRAACFHHRRSTEQYLKVLFSEPAGGPRRPRGASADRRLGHAVAREGAVMRAESGANTADRAVTSRAGDTLNLLLVGPLSRGVAVGGTSVSFGSLVRQLQANEEVGVDVVDTGRDTLHGARNVAKALTVAGRLLTRVRRADVVIYNASARGILWLAPLVHVICRLSKRPWILRAFGGNLDELYERAHPLSRYLSARTTFSADLCLLQTRQLMRRFESVCRGRVEWFPTSLEQPTETEVAAPSPFCSRFVYVGRVSAAKGAHEILAATERLAAETNGSISVDIYGPLVDGMTLDQLRGVPGVRYRGEIESDEVIATLRRYDALLLPTKYPGEGYPGVIVEAYAAGLPVIASRWRAIPEIVDDSCGILIAPRDAVELYEAMGALVARPELYRRLQRGALEKRAMFCLHAWANTLVAWCRELAAPSSASRGGGRSAHHLPSSVFHDAVDGRRDPVVRDGAAAGGGGA